MTDGLILKGADYWWYCLYSVYYRFIDYPLMIRVCAVIASFCVIVYVVVGLGLIIANYAEQRRRRRVRKLEKRYGEDIDHLLTTSEPCSLEEMADQLQHSPDAKINGSRSRAWIALLASRMTALEEAADGRCTYRGALFNAGNYGRLLLLLRLAEYMEKRIESARTGKWTKVRLFRTLFLLRLPVSRSIATRYTYDKNPVLRKTAIHLQALLTADEPYGVIDKDVASRFVASDCVEMHYVCRRRDGEHRSMPDFCLWLNNDALPLRVKAFGVDELGEFGQREHCGFLYEALRTCAEPQLKCSIIAVLGRLQYTKAEDHLMQLFRNEDRQVRKRIVVALGDMQTGHHRVVEFFKSRYERSRDVFTTLLILNALYEYGVEGRQAFDRAEAVAADWQRPCFDHIRSPYANDKSYVR